MSNAAIQMSDVHVLTKVQLRTWGGGVTAFVPLADVAAERLAENELVRVWDVWERQDGSRYTRDIYDAARELEAALEGATWPIPRHLFPRQWDEAVKTAIATVGMDTWLATRRAGVQ